MEHVNDHLKTVKFIQDVERHPCLYNFTLPDYSRRDITETAWLEVGKNNNMTVPQCKEKWKNLRTVFTRHLNPEYSKRRKPYYLSEVMQFAIPYIKSPYNAKVAVSPKLHCSDTVVVKNENDVSEQEYEEEDSKDIKYGPVSPEMSLQNDLSLQTDMSRQNDMSRSNSPLAKKRKLSNEFDIETCHPKTLLQDDLNLNSRRMFLLSLLPDVYSLTDSQMRKFRIKVLTSIDEIVGESENNCKNVTS